MRTLRSIDSPWRRLPWTLPAALLICAAALWGVEYFMERPTHRPVKPPPIDARLIDLPAPVATATLGPGPPTAVDQPEPPPPVIPKQVPVKPQVSPRTIQKPLARKAKVITSAVDEPGNALTTPGEDARRRRTPPRTAAPGPAVATMDQAAVLLKGSLVLLIVLLGLSKTMPVYPGVSKRLPKKKGMSFCV